MSAKPTGRLAHREDGLYLMVDRLFAAPIADVWASLTRPAELEKWVGTYTGSPSTGAVKFRMSAEEGADWEYVSILECRAPHRFAGDFGQGDDAWRVMFHLVEGDGMTTLTFGQRLRSAAEASTVGPGWDYYLDRLVAARARRPLPEWEHYYPAHAQFYRELMVPMRPA
ncbi:SRPBCC domain-containing protein [Glaciibacter superstes]|uniref:SRPBCC domain-containing protein n=1 Tax=Glaciibacter superstes TaxID=501023 RepID=UPI0003B33312|nr:SRPBCC domain-containing protein [Glaciibacter superstes]